MELKNHLLKGNLPTLLLALLKERPRYGFEIANEIHERTGNYLSIKEGTMYPALRRLDRDGLVKSWWQDNSDGPQRRYYKLTPKGEKHLSERLAEWAAFSASVNSVLEGPAKKQVSKSVLRKKAT